MSNFLKPLVANLLPTDKKVPVTAQKWLPNLCTFSILVNLVDDTEYLTKVPASSQDMG
jgi:hypothetical protein